MGGLPRVIPPTAAGALVVLALVAGQSGRSADHYSAQHLAGRGACTRFAAPAGTDRAAGTRARPFRTVKRLTRSLRRGQTGCLLAGRYRHRGVAHIRRPGVTLRSVRGARARVDGTIWVDPAARGASVVQLFLTTSDAAFSIPLKVQADDVTVRDNVITGRRNTICLAVGSERPAFGTLIERNRISHCGRTGKLDHLIYLVHSRGAVIRRNVLTDNPGGWAIHLFPDADGSVIEHNRIERNQGGVIFGGADGQTSDGNEVRNNAITFSSPRWNVEASWSGNEPGAGNSVHHNCLYTTGPSPPEGIAAQDGFESFDNVVRSPTGSCSGLVGKVTGPRPIKRTSRQPSRRGGRR